MPGTAARGIVANGADADALRRVWSVAALLLAVGDALAARFGALAVRGELASFTRAPSGHCYFTLKDADGSGGALRCAMFRRAAAMVDFAPRDGHEVELRGRLAVYEARGELQFVVESMRLAGSGSLYEQFLRLKARLEAEGLFDPARKRSLVRHPTALGVVTSLGAAALHDVLTTLARRAPHVRVVVYPSLVQGAEAPAALVQALRAAAARHEVDTLILCRGGGSLEDLWAFNDERVVRAVVAMPMPVVCGVGHETDFTLADFAADVRAPTPTGAAELAAPARADELDRLAALHARLQRAAHRRLEREAQRLDQAALRWTRPSAVLAAHRQRLALLEQRARHALLRALQGAREQPPRLAGRLRHAVQLALQREAARLRPIGPRLGRAAALGLHRHDARLQSLASRLQALDPQQVLTRGYAWVTTSDERPLVSAGQVQPGDGLRVVWADGVADTRVVQVHRSGGEAARPEPMPSAGP